MDYTQPDYWSTSAQLIIILWLIIAIELRPSDKELRESRRKTEPSTGIRRLGPYLWLTCALVLGGISLLSIYGVISILSGIIDPTPNWEYVNRITVMALAFGALAGLIGKLVEAWVDVPIRFSLMKRERRRRKRIDS